MYGLVNNAALGTSGILATMHDSQIERLVRLNTLSPIMLTKYVVRAMMADGGGRIVNVASIVAFTGYSGISVYSATKASIIGFTKSLAREVGPLGINVNAVAPGFLDTEMTESLTGQQREQIARRSALHHLAEIDDVANAVEYLLSDKAKNITGTVLTVERRQVMRVQKFEEPLVTLVDRAIELEALFGCVALVSGTLHE